MADDLWLIAHKVRGEPAFDIATQIECPICHGEPAPAGEIISRECTECDGIGAWWIIPTSGHRAYPWWNKQISRISCEGWLAVHDDPWRDVPPMPASVPDHYTVAAAPASPRPAFLQSLLAKPRVAIPRRGL